MFYIAQQIQSKFVWLHKSVNDCIVFFLFFFYIWKESSNARNTHNNIVNSIKAKRKPKSNRWAQ